jgi:hypothetical protein
MQDAGFHALNASRRWYRIVWAVRRRVRTAKQLRVAECVDTNRCNASGDRGPCIVRSRFQNDRWLLSRHYDDWGQSPVVINTATQEMGQAAAELALKLAVIQSQPPQDF